MRTIVKSGLVAGVALFLLSISGLYFTIWYLPGIAAQYFDPAFDVPSGRFMFYYIHPFIISMALAWFWSRFKGVLTGSFISRGIEFGMIYVLIATLPIMWLIYASMNVSFIMILTWFVLALVQGIIAGLVFEKMNP
jgi:hypothetical protein